MIDKNRFCGLSRAKDFQLFLRKLAPDLYQQLINHLSLGKGCRSNQEKMASIFADIKKRGMLEDIENFLIKSHPHIVRKDKAEKKQRSKREIKTIKANSAEDLYDKMNYHKVFEFYRPKLFFIPQRRIIIGAQKRDVLNDITRFARNKIDVDYIILKGPELWHGYVEFFDKRFMGLTEKLDKSQRPIALYRKRNGIKAGRS